MASENIRPKLFFISFALLITVEIFHSFLLPVKPDEMGIGVIRLIEILLVASPFIILEKNLNSIGIHKGKILSGIWKGMIWASIFGIVTSIGFCIIFLTNRNPFAMVRISLPKQTSDIILFFLVRGLIGPIAEEFFFRGILYGFLRKWGFAFAIISSTLLFGIAHDNVSIIQITGGIIFAISYEKEKNLLVPIVIHTLGNLSLFTLSLLS